MPTPTAKATVTARVVDFTNTSDGGVFNTKRVRAGDYLAKVVKVQDAPAKGDNTPQYLFTIQLQKFSQNKYPYYCKLQDNQLWKLRNLAISAGINVPKKRVKFDPTRIVGKLIGVTMEDDEYEGKLKSVIAQVFPASELQDADIDEGDEGEEETEDIQDDMSEDIQDDVEDEEELEDEVDQFADMDRTALKAYLKEQDPTFQARRSQTDDDLRELARNSAGGDEEEDEEPEPPARPAAKKAAARTPATRRRRSAPVDEDEDLEELDLDSL